MKRAARWLSLILLLLTLLSSCGCALTRGAIQEDAIQEPLPGINPQAGVKRDVDITLYFRLTNEPALIPVKRTVTVRANEYVESAVIRQLIAGPTALLGDMEAVLPQGLRFTVSREGGILYVTLSKEILNYTQDNATREEAELEKRLGVYAIVNSLCKLGAANRVQIMVDMDGTGKGTRVSPFLLGFTSEYASSQFLEPMGFEEDVVITPTMYVTFALQNLVEENYAQAYLFFAASEMGGLQKPDYAAFETEVLSTGSIKSFRVQSAETGKDTLNGKAVVDITWVARADGVTREIKGAVLQLIPEGELSKLGYYSLMNAIKTSLEKERA